MRTELWKRDAQDQRSALTRAAGLGSAKTGVEHWWAQRASAVALVPLVVWLVASLLALADSDHAAMTAWLGSPVVAILMVVLLIMLFWHVALGLRVVIEDYVHVYPAKIAAVAAVDIACFVLAVAGVFATLIVAFRG